MRYQQIAALPNASAEEITMVEQYTASLTDDRFERFLTFYRSKRKDPQLGMILGVVSMATGIHGISRFYYGNIGMGILYFFTAGLCMIGTIIDLVNNGKMALECNQQAMNECIQMVSNT